MGRESNEKIENLNSDLIPATNWLIRTLRHPTEMSLSEIGNILAHITEKSRDWSLDPAKSRRSNHVAKALCLFCT